MQTTYILSVYLSLQDGHQEEHPLDFIHHLMRKVNRGPLAVVQQVRVVRREPHGVRWVTRRGGRLQIIASCNQNFVSEME